MHVGNHPTSSVSTWEIGNDVRYGIYIMEPDLGLLAFKFSDSFENLADAGAQLFEITSICKDGTVQLGFSTREKEPLTVQQLANYFIKQMYRSLSPNFRKQK